ncbi:MAG: 4Fe-4S dicluster domain-containing protein [Chloroflexi bacterium]|nr:4Fe-4S dicluster domain-containing protein [Chloroflexota bacterium]
MQGTTPKRMQGLADPVLAAMVRELGLDDAPHYTHRPPRSREYVTRWVENGTRRDGPVAPERVEASDRTALTRDIKEKARELGADLVGTCRLRPSMIDLGTDLSHGYVIAACAYEDYGKVLDGPVAVEDEAMRVYALVSDIATELAAYIRGLGYPALAHHNGGGCIQAIPVFYQVGFGELGRHGSLINERYGANFRPGFVTTDLPLDEDQPHEFGVQDFCLKCNVCIQSCPGGAIPKEYVTTDGIRRWLTDLEKCYPYSRLRPQYCHLCVDVCPFNARHSLGAYKAFMKERKRVGYSAPKA